MYTTTAAAMGYLSAATKLLAVFVWFVVPYAVRSLHGTQVSEAQMAADGVTLAGLDSEQDYLREALGDVAAMVLSHRYGYWLLSLPVWLCTLYFGVYSPMRYMGKADGGGRDSVEAIAFFAVHGLAGVLNALLLSPTPAHMDERGPTALWYCYHLTFGSVYTQASPRLGWVLLALRRYARERLNGEWRTVHTVALVASCVYFFLYVYLTNLFRTQAVVNSVGLAAVALWIGVHLENRMSFPRPAPLLPGPKMPEEAPRLFRLGDGNDSDLSSTASVDDELVDDDTLDAGRASGEEAEDGEAVEHLDLSKVVVQT